MDYEGWLQQKKTIKKVRSQSTIFKEVRLLGFKMEEGGRVQTQILFINERNELLQNVISKGQLLQKYCSMTSRWMVSQPGLNLVEAMFLTLTRQQWWEQVELWEWDLGHAHCQSVCQPINQSGSQSYFLICTHSFSSLLCGEHQATFLTRSCHITIGQFRYLNILTWLRGLGE